MISVREPPSVIRGSQCVVTYGSSPEHPTRRKGQICGRPKGSPNFLRLRLDPGTPASCSTEMEIIHCASGQPPGGGHLEQSSGAKLKAHQVRARRVTQRHRMPICLTSYTLRREDRILLRPRSEKLPISSGHPIHSFVFV